MEERGRSRSRVHAGSADSYDLLPEGDFKHADAQYQNSRIAQTSLASAAAARLIEHTRSKCRQLVEEREVRGFHPSSG